MAPHFLDCLLRPKSLAIFGATDDPLGPASRILDNLRAANFQGAVHPIDARRSEIAGYPCVPTLDAVNEPPDLAVLDVALGELEPTLDACAEAGILAGLLLNAGPAPGDERGRRLFDRALETARRRDMRLLGANSLGLIRPSLNLNAFYGNVQPSDGKIALVCQSGALCSAVLDWATSQGIGLSSVISLGEASDVDIGEILDFLGNDARTHSILVLIETVRKARPFMSGLRAAARMKPVIILKSGRFEASSRAAVSHTGQMVGADDAFDAALARAGAIRVARIEQLFAAAQVLAGGQRANGARLSILGNGAGPGIVAADHALALGLSLAQPEEPARTALLQSDQAAAPPRPGSETSVVNPLDLGGDANAERFETALRAALADRSNDGVLAILTPQVRSQPVETADRIARTRGERRSKPILACFMGESQVQSALERLGEHGIPNFDSPEAAVEAFSYLARYRQSQEILLQVPESLGGHREADAEGARLVIEGALANGHATLTPLESKAVLRAFGIPVTTTIMVRSANEALVAAESVGFPVALKVSSPDLPHKSDVGGVRLNVANASSVRGHYQQLMADVRAQRPAANIEGVTVEPMYQGQHGRELMVGVVRDPVFGPVISFGSGGTAVEVIRDTAIALPPLNQLLAERLIGQTRVATMLGAFRALPPAHLPSLLDLLLRVSDMVCELPEIQELDINPVFADETGVIAADARMRVQYRDPAMRPYDHVAIHPYPAHLSEHWQLNDGTDIVLRPVRPEDAEITQALVRNMSEQSRYFRFMQTINELSPQMLVRFTQLDYDREMGILAVTPTTDGEQGLAMARYVANPDGKSVEFGLAVADQWHKHGLGSRLLSRLMAIARAKGFERIEGEVLSNNTRMLGLMEHLGFTIRPNPEDAEIKDVYRLL